MKTYSQFHDGSLEGLWIDGETVYVYLRTLGKERFTAVATSVVALNATGFREGNIILDVGTRDSQEIVLQDIVDVYDLQPGLAGEEQGGKLLAKARQEGLTMLEVNPSYGGTCLVLAHSVDLHRRQNASVGPMSVEN